MNENYLIIWWFTLILSLIRWRFESRQAKKQWATFILSGYVLVFLLFSILALLKGSWLVAMDWFG